jgi:hypothetical protein
MLFTILLINTIIYANAAFNMSYNETLIKPKESTDFSFTLPDVVKDYVRDDGTRVRLNAYKAKTNDDFIGAGKFNQAKWVSFGKPEIVIFENQDLFNIKDPVFFSLSFEMLNNRDKEVLADQVKQDKSIPVSPSQFLDIKAKKIECDLKLYDDKENKVVVLKGQVFDLNQSPYEVHFDYTKGSKERIFFEEKIKIKPVEFNFKCTLLAGALSNKFNTLTITVQDSNNFKFSEKLFGPASEAYVTRDQLTELSNEVNSYFKVVETYETNEAQFSTDFVQNLISLAGQTTFNPVSFDEALKSLSKYSINFEGDLKPDVITRELSDIFKVEQIGEKSHIIFDEKYYKELEKQSQSSGSKTGSFGLFGLSGSKTSQYAQSQKDKWIDTGSSLDDQLKELNAYSENQIKYEKEGNKIVPKALNVNKLQSSSFKRDLVFNSIKQTIKEAEFNDFFSLNTFKATTKLERKYPNYFIAMLGSEDQLKYFDSNGKGFDEFTGWYLCDGRNGAPDLRERVPFGRNFDNSHRIGTHDGYNHVQLSEAHMPHHTHIGFYNLF